MFRCMFGTAAGLRRTGKQLSVPCCAFFLGPEPTELATCCILEKGADSDPFALHVPCFHLGTLGAAMNVHLQKATLPARQGALNPEKASTVTPQKAALDS